MAIARGAGTEIIRTQHAEAVDSTLQTMIQGVQHHIYTVLSVICFAQAVQTAGNYFHMFVQGFDNKAGTTDRPIYIFQQDMRLNETFVWNDKFSMNGYEPANYTGPMNSDADQNLISDQAGSVAQFLYVRSEHADDEFDVTCTFIDQNNAT